MVTDDDTAIVDALKQILESDGYEVETSTSGNPIARIRKYCPDLLLLDIWMSGQDGRDICKELKSHKETKNIPIIMVSANKDTKKISEEAGADDYIEKPFGIDQLLEMVKKYIK